MPKISSFTSRRTYKLHYRCYIHVIEYDGRVNAGGVPPFANPDFDKAFSEAFLDFALALNPNVKLDPTNITPLWKSWDGLNEMLFNKTGANTPDIRLTSTSSALLKRCE